MPFVCDSVLVSSVDYLDLETFLVASDKKTTHLGYLKQKETLFGRIRFWHLEGKVQPGEIGHKKLKTSGTKTVIPWDPLGPFQTLLFLSALLPSL